MYAEFVIPVGSPVYIWHSLDDFDKTIRGINQITGGVSGHVSWVHTKTELITNLNLVTNVMEKENNLYAVIYDPPTRHSTLGDVAVFALRRRDLKTRDEMEIHRRYLNILSGIKTISSGLLFYQDSKYNPCPK